MIMSVSFSRAGQTTEKIEGFREFSPGWCYGEGGPPKADVVQKSLDLDTELHNVGFARTNAFLGLDGEITVTAYHGPQYLEFTVYADGQVDFVLEIDDEEVAYEEGLSFERALIGIRGRRGLIWPSSDSFSRITTTEISSGSRVALSGPPAMAAGYRSSVLNVSRSKESEYARTLTGFMQEWPGRLRYTGSFPPSPSLTRAASSSKLAQQGMIVTTI